MTDSYDWDALADAAAAGKLTPIPGTALHGADAAASGQAWLIAAGVLAEPC